ncbi:MAG: ABC transporter substrate-binding protein [Proteobacteria bacterium]|nr:ABC transporter substrate-binding protein [Pseudomonadota bacterium]
MSLLKPIAALAVAAALLPNAVLAQKKYDPGASDTEIKIGMTAPLSGPASAYGVACPVTQGFFAMINDQGGINGRKLKLLCEDDGFSPPKAVEQTRKLVESDEVLMIYNTLGTSVNTAILRYLTAKKVPHVLANTAASKFNEPKEYPGTTTSLPSYVAEARIFADYIQKNLPNAKVGILYQNDDYGRDYLSGLKAGLGANAAKLLVAEQSYELSDPTVDSQVLALKSKNVDVVVLGALAKHATQAIRKIGELGWKPQLFLSWSSSSIPTVLNVAGADFATGLLTTQVIKDAGDPRWAGDKVTADYKAFMAKYYAAGDPNNISNSFAYATSYILVDVLKRAGDNLTRENIIRQAQNIDIEPPMYLPGVRFRVTPADHDPIKRFQMVRFDGKKWVPVGTPVGG